MSLLKATGLRASYGQVDVLLGIDIEVNEGEMVITKNQLLIHERLKN